MPLELRKNPDGTLRPYWYGRYEIDGKRYCVNLGIKIAGTPPITFSLKDEGDKNFERSRGTALAQLKHHIDEARSKQLSAHLYERVYEIQTGERMGSPKLANLPDEWQKIPRKRQTNERYATQSKSTLARFVAFLREHSPKAEEIAHVTRQAARTFMETEKVRGITAKTWNDNLKLLRATFKHLLPDGCINPFADIPTRETNTVFRKPFTTEELNAIVDAASTDDFTRPIIITGVCTAMRRGDCCLLRWQDVDLHRRFITVKTAKTGQTVSIPVFPMLYDELIRLQPSLGYVFPDQAKMYLENPDGITWRVRKIFATAGFTDEGTDTGNHLEPASPTRGTIRLKRENGLRRASIRDFHSFRVTWVTLALTAGVPIELVQKVTGHKTAEIVLKHYFQPGREDFRRALHSAMPELLTNGQKNPKDEMLGIIEGMTADSLEVDTERLKKLLSTL